MSTTIVSGAQVQQGSDLVISAVAGEFYAYSAEFTGERPLYALMKCKSNKSRPRAAAGELGDEANLLFLFGDLAQVQVCAVEMAQTLGLLGDIVDGKPFGETWMAPAAISTERFHEIRSQKDVEVLVKICQAACVEREKSLLLAPGTVTAVMTGAGKYGLFFVTDLTQTSIKIDACHILI